MRLDAVGPLFTYQQQQRTHEPIHQFGLRPLFYYINHEDTDRKEIDILYPFITYDEVGDESRFQIFQMLSYSTAGRLEGADERFTLFPFIFINDTVKPEKGYWAVFPVYGEIKNRLTFKRLYFILFPLYLDMQKRDVRTRWFAFPFFSFAEGDGIEGWKFFPFYGYQTKRNAYDKRFILFPFWLSVDQYWDKEHEKHARALLPFWMHEWSPDHDATTALWPFFRHVRNTKREFVEWDMPWPIFVIARGKDYHITRVFPFWGTRRDKDRASTFVLFPLWRRYSASEADGKQVQHRVLFYLYADTTRTREAEGESQRRIDSLPLFQYKRNYDGSVRFQTLALLEPALPGNKNIIRNFSPLWTLFEHQRDANGDAVNSLLWNLWRWERQGAKRQTSFLFGLFQFGQDGPRQSMRLFYLPRLQWGGAAPKKGDQ